MATAEPAPPYDDGSSTESEYYFDPAEEAQELAANAWAHELDVPGATNQPETDKVVIKQESSDYRSASETSEDIALPQGSEWSHGAAVYDDAVERALAMASRFEREMSKAQKEEALTADTLAGNEQEQELDSRELQQKDEETTEVKTQVKPKIVSLKSVKAPTPPASVTNSMVVGLRRPPTKVIGAPSELEKGLSVGRSTWKATGSQASSQKASPTNCNAKVSSSRRTEHSEPQDKSTSTRSTDHRNSQPRCRSRSPSKHPTEASKRPDRSKSQARHRSPSRSRRRRESERRSRSPYRSTVSASPRSRHRRSDDSSRGERSRSPPRYLRYERRSRSRGRDRERHDRHGGSHSGGRHERHDSTKRDLDSRHSSTSHGNQRNERELEGHHGQDSKGSHTARASNEKETQELPKRGSSQTSSRRDVKDEEAAIRRNDGGSANNSESALPRPASNALTSPTAGTATKRGPKDPRVRAQPTASAPHVNAKKKAPAFRHFRDDFERKVHKLKLREADLDEKEAAGDRGSQDWWTFSNRRRSIAAEKAQLESQDLERFEKLYESMTVSKEELERYQTSREFAYRVVRYKRKQEALQQQSGVFGTPEETAVQWRRLDEERQQLIEENSQLFHNVMKDQRDPERPRERCKSSGPRKPSKRPRHSDAHDGEPFLKHIKRGLTAAHRQLEVSSSSRVVVGASLQHGSGGDPLPSQPSNTPWFLKG